MCLQRTVIRMLYAKILMAAMSASVSLAILVMDGLAVSFIILYVF